MLLHKENVFSARCFIDVTFSVCINAHIKLMASMEIFKMCFAKVIKRLDEFIEGAEM